MAELEYKISVKVGKVYAYKREGIRKLIGEGYDCLCKFLYEINKGRISPATIQTRLEDNFKRLAPDAEEHTIDIGVWVDDDTFDSILFADTEGIRVMEMCKLPEIEFIPLVEAPEPPVPPYRSKLLAYDKRRNYSKKSYWNRIRSRLF